MARSRLGLCVALIALCACGDDDAPTTLEAGVDGALKDAAVDAAVDAGFDAALDAMPEAGSDATADATRDATGDATTEDAATTDDDSGTPNLGYAVKLSDTGLYADIATDTIAADVFAFEPAYALWTDGATKRRFLYLPPNTTPAARIDTSDMDHWVFPVGTKAWKEFTRDGVRVETRLLEKTDSGWQNFAYVWNVERTEATVTLSPVADAVGTQHDVPSRGQCSECHSGQPDMLLGVSAIQLSHTRPGLTLTQLIADSRLSAPPSGPFVLPGDALDQETLGMLHANCGHCHAPDASAWVLARGLEMWLTVDSLISVTTTNTYRTTVGADLTWFTHVDFTKRIVPAASTQSALWFRMSSRGDSTQMPPLGTEQVDAAGVDRLVQWIDRLN